MNETYNWSLIPYTAFIVTLLGYWAILTVYSVVYWYVLIQNVLSSCSSPLSINIYLNFFPPILEFCAFLLCVNQFIFSAIMKFGRARWDRYSIA